jgi:DNA-binding CsgD family transcriptional regulator
MSDRSAATTRRSIVELSHSGQDSITLRRKAVSLLNNALPIDAFWFATADPSTLLFTGSAIEGIPEGATPQFLDNELLQDDVNKFVRIAGARTPVVSLSGATRGRLESSPRYRTILDPLGFGDELRAAVKDGASCWGFMCLHRARGSRNFTADEGAFLETLLPHLAFGLRMALLRDDSTSAVGGDGPGLLLLADDLSVISATPAGERWLAEIADCPNRTELPQVVYSAVARLAALECNDPGTQAALPKVHIRSLSGTWLSIHASRIVGGSSGAKTAVIIEPAHAGDLSTVLFQIYGLTPREADVTRAVLRGEATTGIGQALSISNFTVQQHLKSTFEKIGVSSRRELVAKLFDRQHRNADVVR